MAYMVLSIERDVIAGGCMWIVIPAAGLTVIQWLGKRVFLAWSPCGRDVNPLRRYMESCNPYSTEPLSLADRIERIGRALTADELAGMLTVSKITIFKQAKAGRIPSFRVGTCVRFDPRSVAQWLRRN
jgi:excisionase family DNA binding protein